MAPKQSGRPSKQSMLLAMPNFTQIDASSKKKMKVHSSCEPSNSSGANLSFANAISSSTSIERIKNDCLAWNDAWVVSFDWVYFDSIKGRMFCKICECMKRCHSDFGMCGYVNIQLSAIMCHAMSRQHKWASYSKAYGKKALQGGIEKIRGNVDIGVLSLFQCAYYIAKEHLAFIKLPALLDLIDACGLSSLSLYRNDKVAANFVAYISESMFNRILQKLVSSPFFGILVDESIDISIVEHLIISATYVYDNELEDSFLGLIEIRDRTSKGLEAALVALFETYGLDVNTMVSFGSDGAAVMVGSRNGLGSLLKKEVHTWCQSIALPIKHIYAFQMLFKEKNVGLYNKVANFQFIYILHFLTNILEHLASLNLTFQKSFVDVTSVLMLISSTITMLEMEFTGPMEQFGMNLHGHGFL
ncbi:hypothetical protein L7F22_005858 [Adiantum nelumboides]|nr:hypothetical protein [Adiantum nelumboides]